MVQVILLPLLFEMDEMKFYIYPVVLKNNEHLILVDPGYPMFLTIIEKAFEEKGLDINHLEQIILTHHDHDHMGAIKELITKYPNIEVKCSKEQVPYVLGKKKSLRLEQAEKARVLLTEEAKAMQDGFISMLKSVQYIDHVTTVADHEAICEGVKVIETPGHMPGHISLYVESKKTLISGDLLTCEGGKLAIAAKEFVLNQEAEIQSLRKVAQYDIDKIICFHGGQYTSHNLAQELKQIIDKGYK